MTEFTNSLNLYQFTKQLLTPKNKSKRANQILPKAAQSDCSKPTTYTTHFEKHHKNSKSHHLLQ